MQYIVYKSKVDSLRLKGWIYYRVSEVTGKLTKEEEEAALAISQTLVPSSSSIFSKLCFLYTFQ